MASGGSWSIIGIVGAALSCLACLTPLAVLALGRSGWPPGRGMSM